MKTKMKYVLTVMGMAGLLAGCAHTPCNNDYCYNREFASLDDGDAPKWGSAKYEEKKEKRVHREMGQ